jgi:hypothetical protein
MENMQIIISAKLDLYGIYGDKYWGRCAVLHLIVSRF